MPVSVGAGYTPPPPPPPPPPVLPIDDVGSITAVYVDPEGTEWALTDTSEDVGRFTRPEIAGWGATSYEFSTDALPRGGENVRFIRSQPAVIQWPIHNFGSTHMEYVTRARAIKRAVLMTVHRRLTGILRVSRPDGTAREIDVIYQDGLRGEPGEDWLSSNPVIQWYAPDGYWRDTKGIVWPVRYTAGGHAYLGPRYPRVTSSKVLGSQTLNNPGDVDAWPTWVLTGPATSLHATNNTNGKTWTLTCSLSGGQQATITTSPRPIVRGPGDTNLADGLNFPTAFLWPLSPGDNDVVFTVGGAASGTRLTMSYYPRYDGA